MIFLKKKPVQKILNPGRTLHEYPGWKLSDGVSQSFLATWLSCREKANLAYLQGYSSATTSNAISFGTLFHSCVERIYRTLKFGVKPDGINLKNVVDNTLSDFKKQASIWTPDDETNHLINTGYLHILIPAYCKKYLEKDNLTHWFNVEEEFDTVLEGVRFRGKFDRMQVNRHDEVWVWDTKTKGRIDPSIQDRFSFDLQMMVYITAHEKITGKLPSGFVYDIIKRPQLRKGVSETLKHFMDRVRGDVDDSYFHRIRMKLDPEEYLRWKLEFVDIMSEFKEWAEGLAPTYRNPASCQTPWGQCQFSRVCGLGDMTGLLKKTKVFSELV